MVTSEQLAQIRERDAKMLGQAAADRRTLLSALDERDREIAALRKDAGKLPKEPPHGLLMSMALRYDHGLGCAGYYDQPFMNNPPGFHARKLEATIRTMRQLYEEVSGHGFWSPENDCEYVAMADSARAQTKGEKG